MQCSSVHLATFHDQPHVYQHFCVVSLTIIIVVNFIFICSCSQIISQVWNWTQTLLSTDVPFQVPSQIIRDFSWVSLNCLPDEMQIGWTIFLQSDFSHVPSKQLPKQKQSHIGCICAIFLLSEFAYVSLSYSQKRLHSRIRYIGLTFRQNEFSYVSSSGLPKQRHSHIGCICAIFPHCEISNVLSNCLPQQMHSYIGCICVLFLQCVLWNVSSNDLH